MIMRRQIHARNRKLFKVERSVGQERTGGEGVMVLRRGGEGGENDGGKILENMVIVTKMRIRKEDFQYEYGWWRKIESRGENS